MAQKTSFRRAGLASASLIAAAIMIGAPASAQAGFFDQLFGGSAPASEPAPSYDAPQRLDAPAAPSAIQRRRIVRKVADDKPVIQKPTDLMHDRTLQLGDAVMMKTGIQIYTGRESATHRKSDFTALDSARQVPAAQRIALASLDGTRNDPLAKAASPDTLASGRSAAVSAPVVTGIKFTDQRGVTIRYIGP